MPRLSTVIGGGGYGSEPTGPMLAGFLAIILGVAFVAAFATVLGGTWVAFIAAVAIVGWIGYSEHRKLISRSKPSPGSTRCRAPADYRNGELVWCEQELAATVVLASGESVEVCADHTEVVLKQNRGAAVRSD